MPKTHIIRILLVSIAILPIAKGVESELPSEVAQLLKKRNEAVASIDTKLDKHLEKLKLEYMKKGDLKTANAIQALIKRPVSNEAEVADDPIIGTSWDFLGTGRLSGDN